MVGPEVHLNHNRIGRAGRGVCRRRPQDVLARRGGKAIRRQFRRDGNIFGELHDLQSTQRRHQISDQAGIGGKVLRQDAPFIVGLLQGKIVLTMHVNDRYGRGPCDQEQVAEVVDLGVPGGEQIFAHRHDGIEV